MRISMFVPIALLAVSGCISVNRTAPPATTTYVTPQPTTAVVAPAPVPDTDTTTTIRRTTTY